MLPVGMSNDRHHSPRPVITQHGTLFSTVQTTGLNSCVLLTGILASAHIRRAYGVWGMWLRTSQSDPCVVSYLLALAVIWMHILRSQSSLTVWFGHRGHWLREMDEPGSPARVTSTCAGKRLLKSKLPLMLNTLNLWIWTLEMSFAQLTAWASAHREPSFRFLSHWLVWMKENQCSPLVRS